jgi:Flp pilus assembly protein TadG
VSRSTASVRSLGNEQGQAMTEFALVLPILLVILFAIIQFGIVFNRYLDLTDAVRAGARKAAVSRLATDPVAVTKQAVTSSAGDITINPSDITVTSTWDPGSDVTVEATYPSSIDLGIVSISLPPLHSTTKERVE